MGRQAFDGKRTQIFWRPPEELIIIGLDTKDGPEHKLYKPDIFEPLEEWRIRNADRMGIFTPISIRKNGSAAEVTWGRTRVRLARAVNERRRARGDKEILVPCKIETAEERLLQAMSAAENVARKKLSPLDEAREMQRLLSGNDEEDIAEIFGCSPAKVKSRLALLGLAPELIEAVEMAKISSSAALAFKNFSFDEQKAQLASLLAGAPKDVETANAAEDEAWKEPAKNGNGKPRRPTAQAAKAAAGKRVRPGTRQLKAMIEAGTLHEATAHELARWWAGDLPSSKVKGLKAALRAAGLPEDA